VIIWMQHFQEKNKQYEDTQFNYITE
jgi:hypothetical protein